jgi:hypothetical protein
VWLLLASCSLVVGELPEPLAESGPMAGAAGMAETIGGSSAEAGEPSITDGGRAGTGGENSGSGTGNAASCDADHDEHLAEGKCGGDDCDDTDADVFPGQIEYFEARRAQGDYDYDCSGGAEREQLAPVECSGVTVGPCPVTEMGFLATLPACGETGAWGTCKKTAPLNTCDQDVVDEERIMRCH